MCSVLVRLVMFDVLLFVLGECVFFVVWFMVELRWLLSMMVFVVGLLLWIVRIMDFCGKFVCVICLMVMLVCVFVSCFYCSVS